MIEGVGVDIIEVGRIRESIESYSDSFTSRIFTEEEMVYCSTKPNPYQHFAARFAAKEAFSKATGKGWDADFSWREVEVLNESSGKPYFHLKGATAALFGAKKILLSLSHSGDYVTAVVIIEA